MFLKNCEKEKVRKIVNIFFMVLMVVLIQNSYILAAEDLVKEEIALTNSYFLNIEELTNKSVRIQLTKNSNVEDEIYMKNSGTSLDLIQELQLDRSLENEYLITTYFTSSTYGAQRNIIVWKDDDSKWKLLLCPFTRGFAEDRDHDGIYQIIEYYGLKKGLYNFRNGYLVKVGNEQLYNRELMIEEFPLDQVNIEKHDKLYLSELCKLTGNENKNPVIVKSNNGSEIVISFWINGEQFEKTIVDPVDSDKFKINLIDLKENLTLGHPQLIIEFYDGERYRYIYVLAWIEDHIEIVFKHILFDYVTQNGFSYKFYSEDEQEKIKIQGQGGYKIFVFNEGKYRKVLEKN